MNNSMSLKIQRINLFLVYNRKKDIIVKVKDDFYKVIATVTLSSICTLAFTLCFLIVFGLTWTHFSSRIVMKTFDESCSMNPCDTDKHLLCHSSTRKCFCSYRKFWNGSICIQQKSFNKICEVSTACDITQNLLCLERECKCESTNRYWDNFTHNCEIKLKEKEACYDRGQCSGTMECKNYTCSCGIIQYYDLNGQTCKNQTLNGVYCSSNLTCRSDLGLDCIALTCKCDATTQLWNGSSCINYRTFGETCNISSQCKTSQDTVCTSGQCLCLNTSHFHFDSSALKCVQQKNENVSCAQSLECLGDMICSSGLCRCSNISTHYFNQSVQACAAKTSNNTVCVTSLTCRTDIGLTCLAGRCLCTQTRNFFSAVSNSCVACPNAWTLNGAYCYQYSVIPRTWQDAKTHCNSQGANLLNLRSNDDYEFFRPFYNSNGNIWVDLYEYSSDVFSWTSSGIVFQDASIPKSLWWASGEPNDSGSCIRLGRSGYFLGDFDCLATCAYVCEMV